MQFTQAQIDCLKAAGLLPTTGQAEVAGPSPTIPTEKASNNIPLYRVQYTAKSSGRVDTYGVFWSGPCKRTGVHKLGLKPLTQSGRMYKWNRRNSYSKGFFVEASETTRV